MRIGIDARFLTHPQAGGFKTYTENLVAALARVDSENEYLLYLDRSPHDGLPLPRQSNFATRVVPGTWPLFGMPWREQVRLARQAARDRLDLLHSPSLTAPFWLACPSVVTIHDMIWRFAEKFSGRKPTSGKRQLMDWYYRWVPQVAARNAAAIITVSNASKDSIREHLGVPPDRVFVTYEAASPIYRPLKDMEQLAVLRRKYDLPPHFVLAMGSADPRKNIATLVRAYARLPEELQAKYPLAIVWTHRFLAASLEEQIAALGLREGVRFLERVSDDDLVGLYNAAALFVFPSRYEGFGLPLLEAMACGTPVVAANNSSIPEIVGDAARLVNAESALAIADAITELLTDLALRRTLVEYGFKRAAGFSWDRCARETIAVYRKAVST